MRRCRRRSRFVGGPGWRWAVEGGPVRGTADIDLDIAWPSQIPRPSFPQPPGAGYLLLVARELRPVSTGARVQDRELAAFRGPTPTRSRDSDSRCWAPRFRTPRTASPITSSSASRGRGRDRGERCTFAGAADVDRDMGGPVKKSPLSPRRRCRSRNRTRRPRDPHRSRARCLRGTSTAAAPARLRSSGTRAPCPRTRSSAVAPRSGARTPCTRTRRPPRPKDTPAGRRQEYRPRS